MSRIEDPEIQAILRHTAIERIAQFLYVRFLIEQDDARKAADVILDMVLKERGRGNSVGALLQTPEV
jgi:DNA helicase TIP49 (TBP-interacting protein)